MAASSLHVRSSPAASYAELRSQVRKTLLEGQRKIEEQKVLTYWQAGKHIKEHLLSKNRADYGSQIIEKLAEDLEVESTLLWRCLKFAQAFPILAARQESLPLTWAHYRTLITVSDEKKRRALIEKASEEEWTSRELEIEVRNRKWSARVSEAAGGKPIKLPPVKLGPFHTYQIVRPETAHEKERPLLLDCGFSFKKELDFISGARKFKEGAIVTSIKNSGGYSLKSLSAERLTLTAETCLYTYKAFVVDVIDGDTLKVDFRLGFGDRKGEIIRLNHIDCPEISMPEGRAARRFVEAQLSKCDFITVKSVKTRKEKWGRYLGDVFFTPRVILSAAKNLKSPLYLNQLLLDQGHAVKIRA